MSQLKTTSLSHKDNNTGTPNITLYPDGTTSLNYAATGFKNRLINGGMSVNQRGLTLYPAGRANEYTADRWLTSTGMSVSWYSDTNFMPAGFTAAIEIGVTPGQNAVINQRIEQPNAGFWAAPGSTWTLSAWVDKPDNFELNLDYRNGANAILASFSKVGALVKGETDGVFTRVSQTFTAPAFTAGTEYTQANFANLTSGENTRFTGAQLEPGPTASVFEFRFIGTEIALCQRYYQAFDYETEGPFLYCFQFNAASRAANGFWPVQMRTTPNLTATVNAGTIFQSLATNKTYYIQLAAPHTEPSSNYVNTLIADAEL